MTPRRSPVNVPKAAPKPKRLRKRSGQARKGPVVVDLNDPKYASLREQLADDSPVSDAEVAALLRDMGIKG